MGNESRSFRHLWDKYASKDKHGYQDWMGPDGFQGAIEDAVAELQRDLGLERESHEITKRMLDDATTASSEIGSAEAAQSIEDTKMAVRLHNTARFLEQVASMGGPLSWNAMEHARRLHVEGDLLVKRAEA